MDLTRGKLLSKDGYLSGLTLVPIDGGEAAVGWTG
jgi:hypothetical protein